MQSHHRMTGACVPNMSLFDERWNKVMKKHEEMTATREDYGENSAVEEIQEYTTSEMAEAHLAAIESAVDNGTEEKSAEEEDRFALFPIDEEVDDCKQFEHFDKKWDHVIQRHHDGVAVKTTGPQPDQQTQNKLMWLVVLCYGYMVYCGITRLIKQAADQSVVAPDFALLDHAIARIFIFTTLTSNNFAKISRSLISHNTSNTGTS